MTQDLDVSDPLAYFEACLRASRQAVGSVGVAVLGRTGAGKSTLVNAVFGAELAGAGSGAPLTAELNEHRVAGVPVRLVDSRGLQLGGGDAERVAAEVTALIQQRAAVGGGDALHAIWYCLQAEIGRVDPSEEPLIRRCAELLPTIVVLTQSLAPDDPAGDEFRAEIESLGLPLAQVVPVLAAERVLAGEVLPPHGLDSLIDATMAVLPDGARRAFVHAQRYALDAKLREAKAIAARRAIEAGTLPRRGSSIDVEALSRHQLRMLAEISTIFELELADATLTSLMRAVSGTARGAEAILARIMAMIESAGHPEAGIGAALLRAGAAVSTTRVLGEGFARLCRELSARRLRGQDMADVQLLELFRSLLAYRESLERGRP